MKINLKALVRAALALWAAATLGGAMLDPERDAIRLLNYPPEAPCDLPRLAETDRAFGWGRVLYDNATNTCVILGDLIVGANDGSETVLKIGSRERPNETLIMKGNLYLHPYFIEGDNREHNGDYWRAPKRMNALILGEKGDNSIKASLKFACSPSEKHTLYGGRAPWIKKGTQQGGGLYVYNSQIAPLSDAPGCEIGDGEGLYLAGGSVFENATITGIKGKLYRMGPGVNKDYLVKDSTFSRIDAPLTDTAKKVSGCVFSDCGTAVLDRGSLDAELVDCVFKNNQRNWSLTYSDNGLVCVDCQWDTPREENRYRVGVDNTGKKRYPKFSNRHRIVVKVLDDAGKPVVGASVSVDAEQDAVGSFQREFRTGADGATDAIVLTEYIETATDTPDKPAVAAFSYAVAAEKNGKRATVRNVKPDQAGKTVVLSLP